MFSLTREERRVVLFLIMVALVGMGINYLLKVNSKARIVLGTFKDIGKVNLNCADKQLLMSVSGIGEKLAKRIVEYRQNHGAFKELTELKKIKGINDYRYEKIKDYLTIK